MDSFYGGKQGISFVIRARFNSIAEMEAAFQDTNDKRVWYGEYCIIDTVNKNHPDNGKVFRRTFLGDKTSGYAEYIGQFKGSSGSIPIIDLNNLEDTEDQFDTLNSNLQDDNSIDYKDNEGWHHITSDTPSVEELNLPIYESNNDNTIIFKAGSTYGEAASPQLKYNWYINNTVTNSDIDEPFSSKMTIGLEIPYVDLEIASVTAVAPTAAAAITERTITNSFYKKYDLQVPAGAPGTYITNIREERYYPAGENNYFDFDQIDWTEYPPTLKSDAETIDLGSYKGNIWICSIGYYNWSDPSDNVALDNIYISKEIQPKYLSIYPSYYYCNFSTPRLSVPTELEIKTELINTYGNNFEPPTNSLITTTYEHSETHYKITLYHMVTHTNNDWGLISVGTIQKDPSICVGLYNENNFIDPNVFPYNSSYVKLKTQALDVLYELKETWG